MKISVETCIRLLFKYRTAVILPVVLASTVFGYYITRIVIDNDPTKTIPASQPEKIAYESLKKVYSSPYTIICAVRIDSLPLLEKIDSLTAWGERYAAVKGVDRVIHLGTLQVPVKGGFFGLTGDYLVSRKAPLTEEQLRRRIADNGEFTRILISPEETVFGMVLNLKSDAAYMQVAREATRIRNELSALPFAQVHMTGAPLYTYFINEAMRRDLGLLLPICLLVVSLLLYRIFRSVLYVASSLLIIAVSLVWTFGIMGLAGSVFSVTSSVVPIILFPIGVAYSIHVIDTYVKISGGMPGCGAREVLVQTYRELLRPIFLSAVTTVFGFFSFAFTPISWTRTFGIYTSVGVLFTFLFTLVLLPLLLTLRPVAPHKRPSGPLLRWNIAPAYRAFITGRAAWIAAGLFFLCAGIGGILLMRAESNPIALFPRDSDLVRTDGIVARYFGGTRFFSVMLTRKDGTLDGVDQWREVSGIASYLAEQPEVGNVASMLPLVRRVSSILSGDTLSGAAVSLLMKSEGLFGRSFKSYIDGWVSPDRTSTKLELTCRNDPDIAYVKVARRISSHIESAFPQWKVLAAGNAILNDAMVSVLIKTMVISLLQTIVTCFLVLVIIFRSFRIGLIAITPISLAALTINGIMGLSGVTLNLITVVIVNTCIGVGVDYAIHFTADFLDNRGRFATAVDALMATAAKKAPPILFNSFVVGIGFLVLTWSTFPPIRTFGILVFVSMIVSSAFSLLFLPVLLRGMGRTTNRT